MLTPGVPRRAKVPRSVAAEKRAIRAGSEVNHVHQPWGRAASPSGACFQTPPRLSQPGGIGTFAASIARGIGQAARL